jgi:hypothetical protein
MFGMRRMLWGQKMTKKESTGGCDCKNCASKCEKAAEKTRVRPDDKNPTLVTDEVSLLERLFDEENDENIILFDADGKEIELEQIATITHEGEIYAVLHVVGDPEDEAVVFHVNPEDEESINMVEDEALGNKILQLVMEMK